MAMTHTYKLKMGDNTFEGEVELSNAGVVAFTETNRIKLSDRLEGIVKNIFEEISQAYGNVSEFEEFEITQKK